jgi:hypothetical protein
MADFVKIEQPINELINGLAQNLFSMSRNEAWDKGICIKCKQPAEPNCYSNAGLKEYSMSALCEKCFDKITGGGE